MDFARRLIIVGVFLATLGVCRTAFANAIAPYAYFWPGIISITISYALPASLLASFIERPFLSAAGIKQRTLALSLHANCVSAVIGLLLVPIGAVAIYALSVGWCVIAFGVSCVVEIATLRRYARQPFRRGWVIGGNAVSSIVLMAIPPTVASVLADRLTLRLDSDDMTVVWGANVASVIMLLGGFALVAGVKSKMAAPVEDADGTSAQAGTPATDLPLGERVRDAQ